MTARSSLERNDLAGIRAERDRLRVENAALRARLTELEAYAAYPARWITGMGALTVGGPPPDA